MAISFSKYIDIVSGVGAGASVRQRDLIGRLFTTNELLPTGSMVEMTTSDDVKNYFGADSEEYKRALVYFGFVSKNIVSPKKISFASFTPDATAPKVFGGKITSTVASFESITNGSINVTMGATTNAITGIDFTGVATLSDVADVIKTAVNAETGTMWTAADVTYDAVNKRFNLVGGSVGAAAMNIQAGGTGTNIATLINWIEGADPILYARFSDGAAVQTYVDCVSESASANNNFGSFEFLPIQGAGLVYMPLADAIDVAVWNNSENIKFIFCLGVFYTDTNDYSDGLLGYSGTALTLVEDALVDYQYPEMIPMIVLAATDYTRRNAVQNYMYQQVSGIDATVTSTSISDALDLLRVNYYGQTQTAGQKISFYQRGLLCGGSTSPTDMHTYANELWFKDACSASLMTLLLALSKVSANREGRGQVLNQLLSVIDVALFNGTISVAKALTITQKQYIDGITGVADSWRTIVNVGYWLDVEIQSYVTQDSRTEYKAVYTLIYSKDDTVKKIEGTHILI